MAFERFYKYRAAALESLEQVGATEAHQALSRARKIIQQFRFCRRWRFFRPGGHVVTQTITRQIQRIDRIDDVHSIQLSILIAGVRYAESHCFRHSSWEVGVRPIAEGEILAPIFISLSIILLDERARASHHV